MGSWRLKIKNAADSIKEGGLLAVESGLKMCPMTVIPYFGYKYARYGKHGVITGFDPVYQVTDTYADIIDHTIDNFHEEPLWEKHEAYYEEIMSVRAEKKSPYTECVNTFQPYFNSRDDAKLLCQRIMSKDLTETDMDWLKAQEKRLIDKVRTTTKEVIAEGVSKAGGMINLPSTPSFPDFFGRLKMPSLGIAKYVFLVIIVIIGLIALGYSGVGGILGREHERKRG